MNVDYENLKKVNRPFMADMKRLAAEVIESGWYIRGSFVQEFEKAFSEYHDGFETVGVASGLDALILILDALNLPKGSSVLVPANSYIASIISILRADLKPVLVEPEKGSCNMDPLALEKAYTQDCSAVLLVHLYGKMTRMDPIVEFCKEKNLKLIEDCAQAHGARYKGRLAGTFGDASAFSFYPTKNLGALGDAGAVLTKKKDLAERIRKTANYGFGKKYYCQYVGYNSRLDEMQAAFLSLKLPSLNQITEHKRLLANLYFSGLSDRFILPEQDPDFFDVFHIFAIRHPRRDQLREYLLERGIKTEVHYPVPPHKQQCMKGILSSDTRILTEEIHNSILSLPISFSHTEDEVRYVVDCINRFPGK